MKEPLSAKSLARKQRRKTSCAPSCGTRENGHEREYYRKQWIESSGKQRGALSQEQSARIRHADLAGRYHDLFPDRDWRCADEAAEPHQSGSAEQLYRHHGAWYAAYHRHWAHRPFGRLGLWLYRCARGCDE